MANNNEIVNGPISVTVSVNSGEDGTTVGEPYLSVCGTVGGCECNLPMDSAWRVLTDGQKATVVEMFEKLRSDIRRLQWNPILKD